MLRLLIPLLSFCAAAQAADLELSAAALHDKIRGGQMGQILGDLNGLAHEMKYIAEPGNVERYVPSLADGAWTDDDTDIEWIYILEMERSGTLLLPPGRMAELWRRHINRRIWCSHLYLRQLLDIGIEPPLTGSVHLNPWAEFNLSGQFVSETWGLIAPGMPRTAARMAAHYLHASVDGEPVQAAQVFSSMIAAAFTTGDIERILDTGAAAADPRSEMRRILADVRAWHKANRGDWRATRARIKEKYALYGGQDMRDRNGVKLNGASTVAALLYGNGDLVETLRHAFNFGWDADNNAATAGTIIGVIKGGEWIARQGWNIKDVYRNTSRDAMPEDETITRFGGRLIALADRVIASQGGAQTGGRYRIRAEAAANVERLPDFERQRAELRAKLGPEVERAVARGAENRELARAAYLAICLDLAPALQKSDAERWGKAAAALAGYPGVVEAMFRQSAIPAGERIRERAVAAGVRAPAPAKAR
jgi:ADP-ribosylglycohydrolase